MKTRSKISASCYGDTYDEAPVAIKLNFQKIELAENEMKDMFNSLKMITRDLYFYVSNFLKPKTKENEPYQLEFYNSIKAVSEEFSPGSLLGYVVNSIAENGIKQSELLVAHLADINLHLIIPYKDVIEIYYVINKSRYKINEMYSHFISAKNKLKRGEKHLTNKSDEPPQIELFNIGVHIQECQQSVIKIFKVHILKQKIALKSITELLESQLAYHEDCLVEINKHLDTLTNRIANDHSGPVFGVSLKNHIANCNSDISVVINDCVAWIMNYGLEEEGIFRLAGKKIKIDKLAAAFDAGIGIPSDFIPSVHEVCGVLKQYIRSLPESILFKECTPAYVIEIFKLSNEKLFERIQKIIEALPREYYNNLKYFFCFLHEVISHRKTNFMTTQNIGVVFGPAMITGVTGSDEKLMELSMRSASVVGNIIEQFDTYFPEGCQLNTKDYERIFFRTSGSQTSMKIIQKGSTISESSETLSAESEEENSFQSPYYFTNANAYNYL